MEAIHQLHTQSPDLERVFILKININTVVIVTNINQADRAGLRP
jgi:hypothetical protein